MLMTMAKEMLMMPLRKMTMLLSLLLLLLLLLLPLMKKLIVMMRLLFTMFGQSIPVVRAARNPGLSGPLAL